MATRILDNINSPDDLKKLSDEDLLWLCGEIRERLVSVVSKNGGHLASNLGVVELTVALHTVFNSPHDAIIFDVGHQAYVHKLLTGRNDRFETLRREDGISGFTRPFESEHDIIIAGHASAAFSKALGIARARKLKGEDGKVVVVIGDGAFSGGMVYEALNNIDADCGNLVIVLNDNSMSISKSVGALSKYLLKLRTKKSYNRLKTRTKNALEKIPLAGPPLVRMAERYKRRFRRSLFNGTLFEEFGLNYVGPVDGHNLETLTELLSNIKSLDEPILFHVKTQKGRGYELAEDNPGAYHGVSGFTPKIDNPDISRANSFSNVFGLTVCEAAENDERIIAITAAMKYATGLNHFAKEHPERFFDVGIAEQHAVTFASGVACAGFKPVVAIYSTFLQRAYDQIIHDVMIERADVLFAVDRAGIVGDDGETHQGIFDAAFLSQLVGMQVYSPCNYSELHDTLIALMAQSEPRAIRFPRGAEDARLHTFKYTGEPFDLIKCGEGHERLLVTYGRLAGEAFEAVARLKAECGICVDILKLNRIAPLDPLALQTALEYDTVEFFEEGIRSGGIGERFGAMLAEAEYKGHYAINALDEQRIRQMSVKRALSLYGIDAEGMAAKFTGGTK